MCADRTGGKASVPRVRSASNPSTCQRDATSTVGRTSGRGEEHRDGNCEREVARLGEGVEDENRRGDTAGQSGRRSSSSSRDVVGLRTLLVGRPLGSGPHPPTDDVVLALNECVRGVRDLVCSHYPVDERDTSDAYADLTSVCTMRDDASGIASKRALLLFALYMEPEVLAFFVENGNDADVHMAHDLRERVLPPLVSRFVAHMCQYPAEFVRTTVVLHTMWEDEELWHAMQPVPSDGPSVQGTSGQSGGLPSTVDPSTRDAPPLPSPSNGPLANANRALPRK